MAQHYSLQTMDSTVLHKTFNYNAISFYPLRSIVRAVRKLRKRRDHYTLGEVYRLFESGQTVQDILKSEPDIPLTQVLIARTFHRVVNHQRFAQIKKPQLKIMIDENIFLIHTVDAGLELFGRSSHVAFEGLAGAKDARLWGALRAKGVHILVTKDRKFNKSNNTKDTLDITRCGSLAWGRVLRRNGGIVDDEIRSLPVILHVPHDATPIQIKIMLSKHEQTIRDIYEERVSPVIEVTKYAAKPGKHFFEIIHAELKDQATKLRNFRLEAMMSKFDVTGIPHEELQKDRASMKRAIEHEISQELKDFQGYNAKLVRLVELTEEALKPEYEYSGSLFDIFKRTIEKTKVTCEQEASLEVRLERHKKQKALVLAYA